MLSRIQAQASFMIAVLVLVLFSLRVRHSLLAGQAMFVALLVSCFFLLPMPLFQNEPKVKTEFDFHEHVTQ